MIMNKENRQLPFLRYSGGVSKISVVTFPIPNVFHQSKTRKTRIGIPATPSIKLPLWSHINPCSFQIKSLNMEQNMSTYKNKGP